MLKFAETVKAHWERVGVPGVLNRRGVEVMRRVLAARVEGVEDPIEMRRMTNAPWWMVSLGLEELRGWLEVAPDGSPLRSFTNDLFWSAPPFAGPGWRIVGPFSPGAGDSAALMAERDRCPPSSHRGLVKTHRSDVVGEILFYRLARYLGLPAPPVQILLVHEGKGAGLIWWVESEPAPTLWGSWEDPLVVRLQALAAASGGVEIPEFRRRTTDGVPFLVDNQYAFPSVSRGWTDASFAIWGWIDRLAKAPAEAKGWIVEVWQALSDMSTPEVAALFAPEAREMSQMIEKGWPAVRERIANLMDCLCPDR
ncbi:MAG TPA: hypothetical protein EYP77_02400 [Anaerolineae bacterium]|nr:hypothetical protein [Anaerolineae bacterium]